MAVRLKVVLEMIYGTVGLLIMWLLCALLIAVLLCRVLVIAVYRALKFKQDAKEYAETIKHRTDMKYNKYISLSPAELDTVLATLFSQQIALESHKISAVDHNAVGILYANTLESMQLYIGPETIEALDYYYGKDYLNKWCELHYMLLESNGYLDEIIRSITTVKPKEIEKNVIS